MKTVTVDREQLEQWADLFAKDVRFYKSEKVAAITAIKEALAQPEQEPVAWGNLANWCLDSDRVLITDKDEAAKYHRDVYDLTPLYTTPPQRKPPQAGDGHTLFYEAVRLLDNAIFAQSGDVVRHDSAAHKEALDFFNHVFTRLDLTPPPQRKPQSHDFSYWWFEYGSGLHPLEGEDQEQHAWRVANEAWHAAHDIKGDA